MWCGVETTSMPFHLRLHIFLLPHKVTSFIAADNINTQVNGIRIENTVEKHFPWWTWRTTTIQWETDTNPKVTTEKKEENSDIEFVGFKTYWHCKHVCCCHTIFVIERATQIIVTLSWQQQQQQLLQTRQPKTWSKLLFYPFFLLPWRTKNNHFKFNCNSDNYWNRWCEKDHNHW